jgi:hypothetical protein
MPVHHGRGTLHEVRHLLAALSDAPDWFLAHSGKFVLILSLKAFEVFVVLDGVVHSQTRLAEEGNFPCHSCADFFFGAIPIKG